MKKTIEYITEVFGHDLNFKLVQKMETNMLPFYIANEYEFWEAKLLDINIMFAKKNTPEHFTPEQYKKQLELLEKAFNNIVIFVLDDIEAYKRNRIIQKRVNFIIANKQVFAPQLMLDIKEYALKLNPKEFLQPVAQVLILFHLQKEPLNNCSYKDLVAELKYPYLTVTRAVENIQALGLCRVEGSNIKKIHFELDFNELWEKALPYMRTPVVKKVFTDDEIKLGSIYKANMNALAHYTNINDEQQKYIAVYQNDFRKLHKEGVIKKYNNYKGKYCIELWKYTPATLAKNGFVDPLSLYLDFKDNIDERIQIELKNIVRQQQW